MTHITLSGLTAYQICITFVTSTGFLVVSPHRHGNNCAGVISGVANNNFCGVGLAYDAKIAGKVLNSLKLQPE